MQAVFSAASLQLYWSYHKYTLFMCKITHFICCWYDIATQRTEAWNIKLWQSMSALIGQITAEEGFSTATNGYVKITYLPQSWQRDNTYRSITDIGRRGEGKGPVLIFSLQVDRKKLFKSGLQRVTFWHFHLPFHSFPPKSFWHHNLELTLRPGSKGTSQSLHIFHLSPFSYPLIPKIKGEKTLSLSAPKFESGQIIPGSGIEHYFKDSPATCPIPSSFFHF